MAAVHTAAERAEDTDWQQILGLYELLERIEDNPVVVLNHAVAAAMVHGPQAGLDMLSRLEHDSRMNRTHRLDAVRAAQERASSETRVQNQTIDFPPVVSAPPHERRT